MRRAIVISIIGLGLALGAFYVFSWPTTLVGDSGSRLTFPDSPPGQQLHTGLMTFRVSGKHEIKIVTVRLNNPSTGLSLVTARVGLDNSGSSIGAESGPQAAIEQLPRAPGFTLYPNEKGAFVITFRPLGAGDFIFHGITVTYQTGWITRSVTFGPIVKVKVPEGIAPVPTSTPTPSTG